MRTVATPFDVRPAAPDGGDGDSAAAWARSGALALTGRPDRPPLGPPAMLVGRLGEVAALIERRSAGLGRRVAVDPLRTLTARAAIAGLRRGGQVSCGGATRLLRARDGWLAVTLARPDDVDVVPAWLASGSGAGSGAAPDVPKGDDPWPVVAGAVAARSADGLVERGALLGLPVAALPPTPLPARQAPAPQVPAPRTLPPHVPGLLARLPLRATRLGEVAPAPALADLLVVELASLWAGPLCGSLLARAGARVVKVESIRRPDGARRGPAPFFDLLNAGKRSVALDPTTAEGGAALAGLISAADVVIEGSRPRALAQLGIDARAAVAGATVAGRGPRIWVSLTGHGRTGADAARVAFGDDAAVGGGLVCWDGGEPCFCADAVADPSTGLVAAAACLDAAAAGGRWLLDLGLTGVAAHLAGPTLPVPEGTAAPAPVAPSPGATGPALGEHTAEVLAGIRAVRGHDD
jgi:crotonobetainyl-CoA:carnitine CoA-transferase CaiB-like acyl-CoA transferase